MVFDLIVEDAEFIAVVSRWTEAGRLEILTTHVQEDELSRIPDPQKAGAVAGITRTVVPTGGFVLNFSRLDMGRLAAPGLIEALRGIGNTHTADALIAATARYEGRRARDGGSQIGEPRGARGGASLRVHRIRRADPSGRTVSGFRPQVPTAEPTLMM